MPSPADALLRRLNEEPDNGELRVEAARAFAAEARHAKAHDVLRERFENLVAHDAGLRAPVQAGFPCLCKRCIDPSLGAVTVNGLELTRDFVASFGRVLFFWVPDSLREEAAAVRAAVAGQLEARLAKKSKGANPNRDESEDAEDDADDADDEEE